MRDISSLNLCHRIPCLPLFYQPPPPQRPGNVTIDGASKAHYVAREDDASRAGAVYIFSRIMAENASVVTQTPSASPGVLSCPEKDDDVLRFVETRRRYYCPWSGSRRRCVWEESARLTASDRRGGDLFGAAISVNHESGLVVIGAPGKSLTGIWQEVCSVDGYFLSGGVFN